MTPTTAPPTRPAEDGLPSAPSRRAVLRLVAATTLGGTAAALAAPTAVALADGPAAAGAAGLRAVPVRTKKRATCRRSQVRVKGRCRPRRKKKPTTTPPTKPTTPTTQTTTTRPPAPSAPTAVPITPGTLLSPADRHLVTRFSYGVDTALADRVNAAGGGSAWFETQLATPGTSDPATDGLRSWWPSLSRPPAELWKRQNDGVEGGWQVMSDYQRSLLVRRIKSTRPVLDRMTQFWENHLNVPVNGDAPFTWRVSYGDVVRQHALGRFSDLLAACTTHPAMLLYLNAAVSTARAPNENLGRELLELHTVGRGQYGEADVKASARILTGYHVEMWSTWAYSYRTADHWVGPVTVMGFSDANASSDGRATTAAYLSYLARHPATARRICRKLAVAFVSDSPSDALVEQLAQVYLANDTAIAPVLRTLVGSAEFAGSAMSKVRDPGEDVVATYRALGVDVTAPTSPRNNNSAETVVLWQSGNLGDQPHSWPRPDGAPIDNQAWSSPSRLLASLELHHVMSGGWWPTAGLTRPRNTDWLPAPAVSMRDLVDHLCRRMLHLPTPPGMLVACCQAVDAEPDEVITARHEVMDWRLSRLLTAILDSPYFLKR
jgi:hypothetical protein